MALHGNAAAAIGSYFRSLGTAYQIANDILNFRALDGAADLGSDLARRAPNAVVVQYRQSLCAERSVSFRRVVRFGLCGESQIVARQHFALGRAGPQRP